MPTWSKILVEVIKDGALDHVKLQSMRLNFLKQINSMTGRNVISYYSGWMYRNTEDVAINDKDMNVFMDMILS